MTPPAATAAGRALPRTAIPRAPRRVSGPAARPRRGEDARRTRHADTVDPLTLRALRRTRQLADSRLLDRLIRGRLWIPLVAAGLMGIVFMQVTMLKLNAGIGRAVQTAGTLERQNSTLRADVSSMEAGSRIDGVAHDLGMVVPADGTTRYVSAAGRGLAALAAQRMTSADPDAVLRARAGAALAAGQAAGTATTGSATSAAPPAAAAAQEQPVVPTATTANTPSATTAPTTAATSPSTTTTGTGTTGAGTTGATAAASPPPAVSQPSTGAATAGAPTQAAQQPATGAAGTTTSGGAAAPAQG